MDFEFDQTQVVNIDISDDDEVGPSQAPTGKTVVAILWLPEQEGLKQQHFPVYGGTNVIGRDATDANICIPRKTLSKRHAVIEVESDLHSLYDLGSINKTKRGKRILKPHVRYELAIGDVLRFADVICHYKASNKHHVNVDSGSETGSESMPTELPKPMDKRSVIDGANDGKGKGSSVAATLPPNKLNIAKTLLLCSDSESDAEEMTILAMETPAPSHVASQIGGISHVPVRGSKGVIVNSLCDEGDATQIDDDIGDLNVVETCCQSFENKTTQQTVDDELYDHMAATVPYNLASNDVRDQSKNVTNTNAKVDKLIDSDEDDADLLAATVPYPSGCNDSEDIYNMPTQQFHGVDEELEDTSWAELETQTVNDEKVENQVLNTNEKKVQDLATNTKETHDSDMDDAAWAEMETQPVDYVVAELENSRCKGVKNVLRRLTVEQSIHDAPTQKYEPEPLSPTVQYMADDKEKVDEDIEESGIEDVSSNTRAKKYEKASVLRISTPIQSETIKPSCPVSPVVGNCRSKVHRLTSKKAEKPVTESLDSKEMPLAGYRRSLRNLRAPKRCGDAEEVVSTSATKILRSRQLATDEPVNSESKSYKCKKDIAVAEKQGPPKVDSVSNNDQEELKSGNLSVIDVMPFEEKNELFISPRTDISQDDEKPLDTPSRTQRKSRLSRRSYVTPPTKRKNVGADSAKESPGIETNNVNKGSHINKGEKEKQLKTRSSTAEICDIEIVAKKQKVDEVKHQDEPSKINLSLRKRERGRKKTASDAEVVDSSRTECDKLSKVDNGSNKSKEVALNTSDVVHSEEDTEKLTPDIVTRSRGRRKTASRAHVLQASQDKSSSGSTVKLHSDSESLESTPTVSLVRVLRTRNTLQLTEGNSEEWAKLCGMRAEQALETAFMDSGKPGLPVIVGNTPTRGVAPTKALVNSPGSASDTLTAATKKKGKRVHGVSRHMEEVQDPTFELVPDQTGHHKGKRKAVASKTTLQSPKEKSQSPRTTVTKRHGKSNVSPDAKTVVSSKRASRRDSSEESEQETVELKPVSRYDKVKRTRGKRNKNYDSSASESDTGRKLLQSPIARTPPSVVSENLKTSTRNLNASKKMPIVNSLENESTPLKSPLSLGRRRGGRPSPKSPPAVKAQQRRVKIMFTGVKDEASNKILHDLGAQLADSVFDCTHLITDKVRRTYKFLCLVGRGVPVISTTWLTASRQAGHFVDPDPYIIQDGAAETQYEFSLKASLAKAAANPLLTGYRIHVTAGTQPNPSEMKSIIECCGGEYLSRLPTSTRYAEKTIVISVPEKSSTVKSARSTGIPVVGPEFLLTGVLRQELDIDSYHLDVNSPNATSPVQRKGHVADEGNKAPRSALSLRKTRAAK